jgi:hypothetical protein
MAQQNNPDEIDEQAILMEDFTKIKSIGNWYVRIKTN